ncbi:hypothetical protein [Hoyosella altamirensis]|uniref:Uncharacterized protein n=1 Tax=Hoyosella altamirensis TaxID=616997 RepID=A0A839RSC4_9ACTN|nr:hypothetical protein [Hoyosella altamirensis]MBB3039765.1 hypothetical protein [Hoyosella altamirensis]
MKTRNLAMVIPAAGAALALGMTGVAGAAVIQNAPEVVPAVVLNDQGDTQIEPESIMLAPADGNDAVNFITWLVWNDGIAVGTGVEQVNTCEPTCAEGATLSKPVVIVLDSVEPLDDSDDLHFTEARISGVDGSRTVELSSVAILPIDDAA